MKTSVFLATLPGDVAKLGVDGVRATLMTQDDVPSIASPVLYEDGTLLSLPMWYSILSGKDNVLPVVASFIDTAKVFDVVTEAEDDEGESANGGVEPAQRVASTVIDPVRRLCAFLVFLDKTTVACILLGGSYKKMEKLSEVLGSRLLDSETGSTAIDFSTRLVSVDQVMDYIQGRNESALFKSATVTAAAETSAATVDVAIDVKFTSPVEYDELIKSIGTLGTLGTLSASLDAWKIVGGKTRACVEHAGKGVYNVSLSTKASKQDGTDLIWVTNTMMNLFLKGWV